MQTGFHALRLIYEKQVNGIARHEVLREEMCINLYTLPKRSIAMLSWNVLTTSRQLLVTQLRFRYMFLSASWEHLDSFVRLLLTILDELFLVLNMFHEFSKVHGPSDRSRIVKKCQVVSRIGYRSRQEVSRHTIRHTSCSNSYSGTGPSERKSPPAQVHSRTFLTSV